MSKTKRIPEIGGALLALILAGGCDTLKIANPNAPDSPRALSDPATVQSIAVGAMRTWVLTSHGGSGEDQYPFLTLMVMAKSHVAMWNNYNIRFYTGCTSTAWDVYPNGTCGKLTEGPAYPRVEWQNDPASAQRTQIEALWYGYYSALSSANDVLKGIRVKNLVITDAANTKMVETVAVLVQALSLSDLAMNYDQGFIVDFDTDLLTLKFSTAAQMRDAAAAKFDEAIALATANTFTTADGFFGPGVTYSNTKIVQIANTMAARNLAYFPRNAAQNAAVDWVKVAGYASKGISSGTPFDWVLHQDVCNTWCDYLKVWSNGTSVRVHTRVAHLMDPVSQPDPWDVTLDKNPNSADKRLGDGTYRGGKGAYQANVIKAFPDTNCAKPVGCTGGLDYVWTSSGEFGNKTRGAWHQSAIEQIRYDNVPYGPNPQVSLETGDVDAPLVLAAENDLIWAEALIRGGGDLAMAATLINYTRHGPDRLGRPRGGLPLATAADPNLLQELLYEQDVELPGSNPAPYYNQRRIDKLEPRTPHEMPVPAKELGVLQQALYTCGGASQTEPGGSCAAHATPAPGVVAALVQNAPQVWAQMEREGQARMRLNAILNRR